MKMLVTGGAGFVGTNLIIRLMKDGHEVVSVDNYSTGKKENHQEGCQYHDFDLSSSHTLGIYVDHGSYPAWRDDEYDVIFHIGALARIQPSLKSPHKTLFNNFVSTLNILEYARLNNLPLVYAGSSSYHHGLYSSSYAWSKYSGEELCKLYSSIYDLSTSICRFYNVYGPYQIEDGDYSTILGIFEKPKIINGYESILNQYFKEVFHHLSNDLLRIEILKMFNNSFPVNSFTSHKNKKEKNNWVKLTTQHFQDTQYDLGLNKCLNKIDILFNK